MKELLQKKTVKIGIAVIILAVAAGIISINARSAQRQREYDSHVDAAEKYLTELDYEQAIAEYTLALEIEPNNEEVLNALEQTYLDYAQSLADAGEYEKAVSVLEEGYALIGRESLREKLEGFAAILAKIIEFPFELTDITVMGYDLLDDHYEEICAAYGCPVDQDPTRMSRVSDSSVQNEYGYLSSSIVDDKEEYQKGLCLWDENRHGWEFYLVYKDQNGQSIQALSISNESPIADDLEFYGICLPVPANSSKEEWSKVMQIREIKEKGEQREYENESVWYFQTKWGNGRYIERDSNGSVSLELEIDEQNIEGVIYSRRVQILRRNDGYNSYQIAWYLNSMLPTG